MNARVLVVDDDPALCDFLAEALQKRGYAPGCCSSADEAMALLEKKDFDLVVTDLNLGGTNGIALCERIAAARPDVPVVVLTAFGSIETAVAAIRAGAYDFLSKPVDLDTLCLMLERAVRHRALRQEVTRLRQTVCDVQGFSNLLGTSPAMRAVYDLLERAAESDASVLITGESGTGKELVARALHERSRRSAGPFVAVNCSAIPETLLESQLFGHTKGAFTDARESRAGLFVQAHGGTLLLDEISEMPLALQPKLLRALQERTVRPVGSDVEVRFDVRIVAASNRDIEAAVEERRFREDLFFRIDVIRVAMPPLRARGGDALLLAQRFIEHFAQKDGKHVAAGAQRRHRHADDVDAEEQVLAEPALLHLSAAAAEKLLAYSWPGNVRELQNCVERAVALTRSEQIELSDLPEKVRAYTSSHVVVAGDDPSELPSMEEVERRYVLRVLQAVGGNKVLAAKVLGFDRKTLYRKLLRYGVGSDTPGSSAS
jgi:two-component system response regulator AtoC